MPARAPPDAKRRRHRQLRHYAQRRRHEALVASYLQRYCAKNDTLEGWAVRAILARYDAALRPWLVPRRIPLISVDGMLLRACDGIRDATQVAAAVLADPDSGMYDAAQVFALMGRLANSHRLAWQIDVAPHDIRPERSVRTLLARSQTQRRRPAHLGARGGPPGRHDASGVMATDPRAIGSAASRTASRGHFRRRVPCGSAGMFAEAGLPGR